MKQHAISKAKESHHTAQVFEVEWQQMASVSRHCQVLDQENKRTQGLRTDLAKKNISEVK